MDRANVYGDTAAEGQKASALYLPGVNGNCVIAPTSATLEAMQDLDIRVHMQRDTFAQNKAMFVSKYIFNSHGWFFTTVYEAGRPMLAWYTTGDVAKSARCNISFSPSRDGEWVWLRVTLDVDTGAGNSEVKFYESSDGGSTWDQLGSTITVTGGSPHVIGTANLEIGTYNNKAGQGSGLQGYAEIRDGIDGPIVAQWDGRIPATRQRDPQGNIWTVSGTANGWVTA